MEEHCLVTTKKMLMFYLLIYIQMYIKIYMDITISYWPGDAEIFLCFILTYKARENFVLLSCRISMKVLFSPIFWQLTSVKLACSVAEFMDFMGLYDFSSEEKRFSSGKEAVSHPNRMVNFQVKILQLWFRMLCSALYSYKDIGSKRPQAATVWILRKAKISCWVFCLFVFSSMAGGMWSSRGRQEAKLHSFLGEIQTLSAAIQLQKFWHSLFRKKCHQNVASWIFRFFNRRHFP